MNSNYNQNYIGKHALVLLRVSTEEQKKMFGFPSQLKQIREMLIEPLSLKVDEEKHIIRDTYTGLEFRERKELTNILEMAKRHEFDLVIMDKLDRLGRKGLQREFYRMQLRDHGVRILTTDPKEHADDDSLIGEMVRLLHGFKAEEELNDIRRRTMNGKREKAESGKLVGNGSSIYGYKWQLSEKGKRENFILNDDIIRVDEDGTRWTPVKVVVFVFQSSANGMTIRDICRSLNDKGIPAPRGGLWQPATISQMLGKRAYTGIATLFRQRVLERVPGKKYAPREKRPESEQIRIPIPRIIDDELFEIVQKRLRKNQEQAARNNKNPHESLLRAGLAKCGHCGSNLCMYRHANFYKTKQGLDADKLMYTCTKSTSTLGVCPGLWISARPLDQAAWEYALEVIRDPSQVDEKVNDLRSKDPTADRRKQILKKQQEIQEEQQALRENLAELLKKRRPDKGTLDFLNNRLDDLADLEDRTNRELAIDEDIHQKWSKLQKKLDEFHKFCADMREKIDDPSYIPPYEKKRETCEFFGIIVTVWKKGHTPRIKIGCRPPDIVSLLS